MAWTTTIGAAVFGVIFIASGILKWHKHWRLVWQRVIEHLPKNTSEKITRVFHGISSIFLLGIGIHGILENIFVIGSLWTLVFGIIIVIIVWILIFTQYRRTLAVKDIFGE